MKANVLMLGMLLCCCGTVRADVVEPGTAARHFSITNPTQYKGFTFYRLYYRSYYQQGHRNYPPDTIALTSSEDFAVGDRMNTKSMLLAKDKNGKWYHSNIKLGGEVLVGSTVAFITDVYKITSVSKGLITLKKVKELITDKEGKQKEKKTMGIAWNMGNGGMGGLLLATITALMGMVVLFVYKRKRQQQGLTPAV